MIDCHVHLRDWEQAEKETILHGANLASQAGFTALFDMPNTKPPLTTAKIIAERIRYGRAETAKLNSKLFYAVYAGATSGTAQLVESVNFIKENFPACIALKMFAGNSTGNMGIVTPNEQLQIYKELTRLNYTGVLAVHCEKESLLSTEVFNLQNPETHSLARPPIAETTSIAEQISFVKQSGFRGHLHICHISTKEGITLVQKAKQNGINISCGATAHHALLNTNAYKKYGIYAKMNPPLRDELNRKAIFDGFLLGLIDNIESDHAPHTRVDKQNGASGVPGFAGTLRLIKALRETGANETLLQKLCGENINKIFGTNFEVNVPSNSTIDKVFPMIISSYDFNIF